MGIDQWMSNIQTDELFTEQTDFAAFIQANAIQAENRQLLFQHPLIKWTSMDTASNVSSMPRW